MNQVVDQRPRREVAVVQSPLAIFDTARFEHMTRVAGMMAECALIPESLQGERKGEVFTPWPPRTIVANCFLVVSYAERLGYDPFLVAQSCSVVRGRLMFEGKLIAAALDDKMGVALSYEFGKWDPKNEACLVGVEAEDAMSLAVRVWGVHPTTGEVVDVHGSVGTWKPAGDKSPWKPGAYKRQLRYRGAREWARAHQPQVMLGVYTDDEMEGLVEDARARRAEPVQQSLAERLGAPAAESTGFSRAHVDRETDSGSSVSDTHATRTADSADQAPAADKAAAPEEIASADGGEDVGQSADIASETKAESANPADVAPSGADSAEEAAANDDPQLPEAKNAEEYGAEIRWRIRHAESAEALIAKWNSATEKNRRNKLNVETDLREALKAEVMARAAELRAGG